MEIKISQSLIKKMFVHGEPIDYCPAYIKTHLIDHIYDFSTLAMDKGTFFESLCLGSGFEGKTITDLPRKKNGDKTMDQSRIEMQHLRFNAFVQKFGISIIPGTNTQVRIYKHFSEDKDILLEGDMDIFPTTIMTKTRGMVTAIIDLKLSADINSQFGMFSWAYAGSLDITQALMYYELCQDIDFDLNKEMNNGRIADIISPEWKMNNITFFYLIFDYSPQLNQKIIEVKYDAGKKRDLYEAIRKTKEEICLHEQRHDWEKVTPSAENCSQCSLQLECAYRFQKEAVAVNNEESEFEDINYECI